MASANVKHCLLCKHLRFDGGCPDLSEVTPGDSMVLECDKLHWSIDEDDTTAKVRVYMSMGATCPDFESEAE